MNMAIAILGSSAITALMGSIVVGLFSKKKLSAEATKVITDAASGVVELLKAENLRVVGGNAALSTMVEKFRADQKAQEARLSVHAFWDRQVAAVLAQHGIDLPEPPPLNPDR